MRQLDLFDRLAYLSADMKIVSASGFLSIVAASAILVAAGCSSFPDACLVRPPENKLDEHTLALQGTTVLAYDCVIPQGMGCIVWCETTIESRILLLASEYRFSANKDDKRLCYPTMPVALIRHDPDIVTGNKTGKGTVTLAWNTPGLLGADRIVMDDYPFKNLTTVSSDRPVGLPLRCRPGKVYNLHRMEAKTGKGEKLKLAVYCAFFPQEAFKSWCGAGYFESYDQFGNVLDAKSLDAIRMELGLATISNPNPR